MVALTTITVVSMSSRQRLDIRRTVNQQALQQARALALAGEKFAAATLMRDKKDPINGKTDSLEDDWAQSLPPVPVDQSTIKGCVFDLQGRFNLNNMISQKGAVDLVEFEKFKRLLIQLNIDVAKASATVDWLDEDSEPLGADGVEESFYSGLEPPYRPANRKMASVSELKMVKGFNPALEDEKADYELLLPHIAALPEFTKINVNTATPAVIAAIDESLIEKADEISRWPGSIWTLYPQCEDIFDLSQVIEKVKKEGVGGNEEDKQPYASVQNFLADTGLAADKDFAATIVEGLGVQSNYFQIRIDVSSGEIALTQFSLVRREKSGSNKILQRSRSVF